MLESRFPWHETSLGEKLAPSMMNLLEDDDDEEDEDLHGDPRYGNSPPTIEPLVRSPGPIFIKKLKVILPLNESI